MTIIKLIGRELHLAPYKLSEMRKAAPHIDRLNQSASSVSSMDGLVNVASDLCAVLSIGLIKSDPTLTPEYLEGQISLADLPVLQAAFAGVMRECGISASAAIDADPGASALPASPIAIEAAA